MTNDWCRTLGIEPPTLDAVAHHREANTFALLLVALLERGRPMTLAEAAMRFEQAGISGRARALSSLAVHPRAVVVQEADLAAQLLDLARAHGGRNREHPGG